MNRDDGRGGGPTERPASSNVRSPWVSPEPFHRRLNARHQHEQKSDDNYEVEDGEFSNVHFHQSSSSDEEESLYDGRQRSRSFSDAQEFLSTKKHSADFFYDPAFSPTRDGLHHRTKATRSHIDSHGLWTGDEEDGTPVRSPDGALHHCGMPHLVGSNSKLPNRVRNKYIAVNRRASKRARFYRFVQTTLATILLGYVMILVQQSMLLSKNTTSVESNSAVESPFRQWASKQNEAEHRKAAGLQLARSLNRKTASRPGATLASASLLTSASSYESSNSQLQWYPLSLDSRSAENSLLSSTIHGKPAGIADNGSGSDSIGPEKLATIDQICGSVARNASIAFPNSYPAKLALNSQSKVVITGIVSNPVAFSLALTLATKCGVTQIMGVDQMLPNTVRNRLAMQERIQLLSTHVPKLSKPIIMPFVGLDPIIKKASSSQILLEETGEWNFLLNFEPTHVVHLSSMDLPPQLRADWVNTHSPYVDETYSPQLFDIRNSAVSMEQILAYITNLPSVEKRPQLVYSSIPPPLEQAQTHLSGRNEPDDTEETDDRTYRVHTNAKTFDEILSATYHKQTGLSSIGIRIPRGSIYGPWSAPTSGLYNEIEEALDDFYGESPKTSFLDQRSMGDSSLHNNGAASDMPLLYVDDAVDAIIAAMQFKTDHAMTADVSARVMQQSLATVKQTIRKVVDPNDKPDSNFVSIVKQNHHNFPLRTTDMPQPLNGWTPKRSLFDGLLRTVAWHLDRRSPFGNPTSENRKQMSRRLDPTSGDALLRRHKSPTCPADDVTCHKSRKYLPCISECSIRDQCVPSVFDDVQELMWSATKDCKIVLYTHSLRGDATELPLYAEFMDDTDPKYRKQPLVCNLAFVPRDSRLVESVIRRVPQEKLAEFDVRTDDMDAETLRQRKLTGLNGKLLYRGWVLIWVDSHNEPLNPTDKSLLKLSPGRLFHPDVDYGFFVEDNFATSPRIEDVQFLVREMKREAFPKRTVEKKVKVVNDVTGITRDKSVKYRLPSEPRRRATILFAPLRHPKSIVVDPTKKLSVHDAAKFMRHEIDLDPNDKEPVDIRRQREFYERIPSYVNSASLRSTNEPWYRYSMRHWVRTRWVVHDFTLEESRQLRCEWYQEHVQWETDIDQLSFAHVMAKMELERRMSHEEPDDHVRTFFDEHPELQDLTDSYEWHPMETENNRLYHEPMIWTSQLPDHIDKAAWERDHGHLENLRQAKLPRSKVPLFVRIMSERMMSLSRRAWSKTLKPNSRRKNNRKKRKKKH